MTNVHERVFYVLHEDGNRYGPVGIVELMQWKAENRVMESTQLQDALTNEVIAARNLPELGFPPAVNSYTSYPGTSVAHAPLERVVPAKGESKEWLWSLLCGISGIVVAFFIGFGGIILGITAIQKAWAAHQDGDTAKAIPGALLGVVACVLRFAVPSLLRQSFFF
jgi:hypothetical protein